MLLRKLIPAIAIAGLGCGLVGCGGGAILRTPDAVYATTVSGQILTLPVAAVGTGPFSLGPPESTPGPANSKGLAVVPLEGLYYAMSPTDPVAAMYVSDPAENAIRVYTIGEVGDQPWPAEVGPYPLGSGNGSPLAMVTYGGGRLYVATSTGAIMGFSIGANGALTPVPGSPFAAGAGISQLFENEAYSMPPGPSNVCLYASDNADPNGGISAFEVQSNGALTPVAGSPFATVAGGGPTQLFSAALASPSETSEPPEILYVGLSNANAVAAFTEATDCSLSPLAGSPFSAGRGVASVFGDQYMVFAGNSTDGTVTSFTVNQTNGALTAVATVPISGIAGSGSAFPTEAGIVLTNSENDDLIGLQLTGTSLLTSGIAAQPGFPINVGSGTLAMAILERLTSDPP